MLGAYTYGPPTSLSYRFINDLVKLVQQSSNGQRVNSIFGEGVSPKLRKLRDGLDQLNFRPDALTQHGRARIVLRDPRQQKPSRVPARDGRAARLYLYPG